jgi:RNase P subunit RPR2
LVFVSHAFLSNKYSYIYGGENMTQTDNPLRKYFRQPAVHLRLPSGGKFYPAGAVDLPVNGELPIYPMTAVDEITSRTPDALFNGSAVTNILSSCVPSIQDPWSVNAVDLNALLAAVRLASYGHEMSVSSACPKCGHIHDVTVDLRDVLDNIRMPNYDSPLIVGDLNLFFAPMTYRQINDVSRVQYEDSKLMQVLSNEELDEETRMKQIGEAFRRVTALTVRSIAASVSAIKTQDSMVTDSAQIEELLLNAPKSLFESIKNHVIQLRSATDLKPISMTCEQCAHEYLQDFTLDMSNFFETAS